MEWKRSHNLVSYEEALGFMERHVAAIRSGEADELVWLLEHPPLYTAGTSANQADLLDQSRFPVFEAGRGGEYTYHGPGQRIAYVMLDLDRRGKDLRRYVQQLEQWIILTLAEFGVEGFTREGRIGVWVKVNEVKTAKSQRKLPAHLSNTEGSGKLAEKKVAALGIRVRKWVTYHGIALNVNPDLSHYGGIVPCGISEYGVTSLQDLGVNASMDAVDAALKRTFADVF